MFTFGSGQHGQLGHNSFSDELRPRLVAELWGAKVSKIACGRYGTTPHWYLFVSNDIQMLKMLFVVYFLLRHHTVVLTDNKRVYSFGRRERGQLGRGEESHPSVPLPVQLPQGENITSQFNHINTMSDCMKEIKLLFHHCLRHC